MVESLPITRFARYRHRILAHFSAAGAVTPLHTIIYRPPAELKPVFDRLVAQRVIRREAQDYYWLDLRAHRAVLAHQRRRQAPVAIAVAVGLALAAMLAFYRG